MKVVRPRRRAIEADHNAVDENTLVFIKDSSPVLTCTLTNVNCWFPDDDDPVPIDAQVGQFTSPV